MIAQAEPRVIEATAAYPKVEFLKRVGWTQSAYRAAVRRKMPVRRVGKRAYILGGDFIEWLRNETEA